MRAHLSIIVSDVAKTSQFYEKVFGEKPQKLTKNYAKFDLASPPLNFTFMSSPTSRISQVSHLGIEVTSKKDVIKWKEKLTKAGILTREEMAVNCCYAQQDKIWFSDPDDNEWEVFFVKEQLKIPQKELKATCNSNSKCCA